jgi:hypothetical protein
MILASWGAEIGRITIQGQLLKTFVRPPSQPIIEHSGTVAGILSCTGSCDKEVPGLLRQKKFARFPS